MSLIMPIKMTRVNTLSQNAKRESAIWFVCLLAVMLLQSWSTFAVASTPDSVDPFTVELFETYCQACHSVASAGAPVAFDEKEWEKRLERGFENVVNSAVLGAGNMPAQGSCMECTYEDIEDLVRYMSKTKPE